MPAADAAAPGAPVQQLGDDKTLIVSNDANDTMTSPRAHLAPGVAHDEASADAPPANEGLICTADEAAPAASGPDEDCSTATIALHQMVRNKCSKDVSKQMT